VNCLKQEDPNLLVFTSDQVLGRVQKYGDIFEPVLQLKQKLPSIEKLVGQGTAAETSISKTKRTSAAQKTKIKKASPARTKRKTQTTASTKSASTKRRRA
jgi:bifunctional non-homologous end joining protein LigD